MGRRSQPLYPANAARLAIFGVAMAVLFVGLYLGPIKYLRSGGRPWVDILPVTFEVWETQPASQHGFAAFQDRDYAANLRAYKYYSQPWLFFQYACLQPWRWVGIPYDRAQMAMCVPHLAVLLLVLFVLLPVPAQLGVRPLRAPLLFHNAVLALAVAAAITLPSFWIPFFRFNPEHYFFVPALAACYLAGIDSDATPRRRDVAVTLLPIALFAPLFAPFLIFSWFVLWHFDWNAEVDVDRRILMYLVATGLLAAAVMATPLLLDRFVAASFVGSRFSFRTGLDGSQAYFTSMAQALAAPSYPPGRPWHLWQWPAAAIIPIAAAALSSRATAASMIRQLFISWLPLLWMVIVFPQLVSIHPYLTDFNLMLGPAICLCLWIQRPDLARWIQMPALRLAIFMTLSALLMTNLLDLARMTVP